SNGRTALFNLSITHQQAYSMTWCIPSNFSLNNGDTERFSWIRTIASAINSDTVTCLILSIRFSSVRKIESETTTSSKSESSKRWIAGPDNTGCVQQATTDNAPASLIADAARVMVPAVSIMSSMMMA